MSGVFARYHEKTGLEFWDNAVAIEAEVYRFTKKLPKGARFTHSVPLYKMAQRVCDRITEANSIYPSTDADVQKRRDLIQEAIGYNECIIQQITRCIWEVGNINITALDDLGDMLVNESKLLRAWRNSTKAKK